MWRNSSGGEVRLAERADSEPMAVSNTGESWHGLTLPEMYDVIVNYMEDHP